MRIYLFSIVGAVLLLVLQGCASSGGRLADRDGGARLQAVGDNICQDVVTGLFWQVGVSDVVDSYSAATGYAGNLDLGGHQDWRLPTKDELYTLHDLIEGKLTGDCVIKEKGMSFWTGESERWGQVGYWQTHPLCGGVDYEYKKQRSGVVRAVRP